MFFTLSFFELPLCWLIFGTLFYITLNYIKLNFQGPFFSGGVLSTMLASRFYARLFLLGALSYFFQPKLWYGCYYILGNFLVMTPSIAFVHCLLLSIISLFFYTGIRYIKIRQVKFFEYPFLLASLSILFLLLCMSYDYFILFLFFESITLLFILTLGGLRGLQKKQILAAFFYFLFNIVASLLYLLGSFSIFILGYPNTFFVSFSFSDNFIICFGILCFILFFCFKLSLFPLHWWTPFIYEKSPLLTLMFIAMPSKIVIVYILIKLLYFSFSAFSFFWSPILMFFSLFSMIIGSFALIKEQRIRKFWGYSTINHMGYIGLGCSLDNLLGIQSALIYLIIYIILNLIFFFIYQNLYIGLTVKSGFKRILFINELSTYNLFQNNFMFIAFSLLLFSLIGIPPLFGFWGKYFILLAVLKTTLSNFILYVIVIIILFTTLITSFAYLNIWKTLYTEKGKCDVFLFFNIMTVRLVTILTIFQVALFFYIIFVFEKMWIYLEQFIIILIFC
jgi:NADH-quinone oxidoreductase subunit N